MPTRGLGNSWCQNKNLHPNKNLMMSSFCIPPRKQQGCYYTPHRSEMPRLRMLMRLQFPRHAHALKPSPPPLDDDDDDDPAWWWWWWCHYPSGFASNGTARARKTPDWQDRPSGPTAMAEEPHIPTRPLHRGPHECRRGSFQNTLGSVWSCNREAALGNPRSCQTPPPRTT